MNEPETWTTGIFGILPHPSSPRALMIERESGWALPGRRVDARPELTPGLATRELRQALGFPVVAVRYARIKNDEPGTHQEGIFVLDALAPVPDPPAKGRWVSRAALTSLPLAEPDHRGAIDDVLRELETGDLPAFRQPWEQPGWFMRATSWIEGTLESLGREITSPPVQVQWWSCSAVLRVGTTEGDLYFKAATMVQPLFCNEPRVMAWLANHYPGRVPALVASDPGAGWMLLEDAGALVGHDVPLERKSEVFRAFGAIQRDSAGHVDDLLALGCADRRPVQLIPRIEPLLNDGIATSNLTADDLDELRGQVPAIAEMCRRLADGPVPSTLIHGDLHLANVASRDATLTFFDWTDASVSHPFVDMFTIFGERDVAARNRLRDAYLALWTGFAPMERLQELWSLAAVVQAMHHAVSYHVMVQHTEERAKGEIERAVPAFLGRALRYLRDPA